jgi:hypothetical protein
VTQSAPDSDLAGHPRLKPDEVRQTGLLIVNADDWGLERQITDRIVECIQGGAVSSVSAMVFMADSERAAAMARERKIDAGLHLNLTTPFSAPYCPTKLIEHQQRISRYLRRHRYSQVVFHPGLVRSFKYVVSAQCEEYQRLYGAKPQRLDGHKHMHLCANVLLGGLLPRGTIVRRNFSFLPGEKSWGNRFYRKVVDRLLARRHRLTDFFFSLPPLEPPERLHRIFSMGRQFVVEVETHPVKPEEYRFLQGGEIFRWTEDCRIAPRYAFATRWRRNTYLSPSLALHPSSVAGLPTNAVGNASRHVSVCVCTYKRPESLRRLLGELARQDTGGLFTYSIVVADNDYLRSAEAVVSDFTATSTIPIKYCVEPRQNIALARNKALENAGGDFIAFIDDDEFPCRRWLLTLFNTCNEYGVDGVLGPVKPLFEQKPPAWVLKSTIFDRPSYPTGFVINWRKGRTGNVLLRKEVFESAVQAFRPEFLTGEDQDFFRRMIEKGYLFIWCDEALANEVVPPVRWTGKFMMKKALLRGMVWQHHPAFGALDIAKSVVAVPAYVAALPFALMLGQHRFMDISMRLANHLGKLLSCLGIKLVEDRYVTE